MASVAPECAYAPLAPFAMWAGLTIGSAWEEFRTILQAAKLETSENDVSEAVRIAIRSAALETGAIEGLYATSRGITRAVATQAALWDVQLDELGDDVRGHFEAQLEAFDMVLDIATGHQEITESWIRQLHAVVTRQQSTYRVLTQVGWQDHGLNHGGYKAEPNNVLLADGRVHWYAPVDEVPIEMHRLLDETRSPTFITSHPVLQAAYVHHALTAVHPFADGNGRVARALASVFLYRSDGIPLVIFSDQEERYWNALAAADGEVRQPFVTFIEERALDTMAMVSDRIHEAKASLDQQAQRLRIRAQAHGGLPLSEVKAIGRRLMDHTKQVIRRLYDELDLGPDFSSGMKSYADASDFEFWNQPYRQFDNDAQFGFLTMSREQVLSEELKLVFGLSNDKTQPFAFAIADALRPSLSILKLRLGDVHPSLTAVAEERIESWLRQDLSMGLSDLERALDASGS